MSKNTFLSAIRPSYPLFLGNRPLTTPETLEVTDKFTGKTLSRVSKATPELIGKALALAEKAAPVFARVPAYERRNILAHCVENLEKRREELTASLCLEGGKPLRDSKTEVQRLLDTFRLASEECLRVPGELTPMDYGPRTQNYLGLWKRFPIGVCSFVSPFNFPLNLVAHKVAPAIAMGCPFILKPASYTPIGALIIGEVLAASSLPEGTFSILPCDRNTADLFVSDPRIKFFSFTGSPEVGWQLKNKSGKKKVTLELGGNAACIVNADANIDDAVQRILMGTFSNSGQSCISVQRILVHESIYPVLKEKLVTETAKLVSGDPSEESTAIGPLISEKEAIRLEEWISSAVKRGAKILVGGSRKGAVIAPTLLENVSVDEKLCQEEAFGPIAILSSFKKFEDALQSTNQSRFGLQAGIFTKDISKALEAWNQLDVGGVVINDVPSFRADSMPYGGIKDSGLGREGIRFAMEDMSEIKMLAIRQV